MTHHFDHHIQQHAGVGVYAKWPPLILLRNIININILDYRKFYKNNEHSPPERTPIDEYCDTSIVNLPAKLRSQHDHLL